MITEHRRAAHYCSICYLGIEPDVDGLRGHDARPINRSRCCLRCFEKFVVPARERYVMWMNKETV